MSRFVILVLAVMLYAGEALARSPEETNAVVRILVEKLMRLPESSDVLLSNEGRQDDLFAEGMSVSNWWHMVTLPDWTSIDNRAAICWYLNDIPNREKQRLDDVFVHYILGFAEMCGYTNFMNAAENIIFKCDGLMRESAWDYFTSLAQPSQSYNDFVDAAIANGKYGTEFRLERIYETYAERLAGLNSQEYIDVITNGAIKLYHSATNHVGEIAVDMLLVKTLTGYAYSSNRLYFATHAIQEGHFSQHRRSYFAPITNRLMSIQGPLPEVEELRR